MAPSPKLSRSGYLISEIYTELEIAILATDNERACGLTAELSCTAGQARPVVAFLINTYCTRRINSLRAQMSLLRSSLAHMGDGTPQSPGLGACLDPMFRRGLCTLTLLVASSTQGSRDVTAAFAGVARAESIPTLALTIQALRESILNGDARRMSSILRAVPDEAWCEGSAAREGGASIGLGQGMPDVQRLRTGHRRDPVWDVWRLARELAEERGVLEYVDDCLHAFAWGFGATIRRARIHLLWYAFLVIIKGAPRAGPHPVDPDFFEKALASIDTVFVDILGGTTDADSATLLPKTKAMMRTDAEAKALLDLDARTSYLLTVTKPDPGRLWEVERDRQDAVIGRRLTENDGSLVKSVVVTRAQHVARGGHGHGKGRGLAGQEQHLHEHEHLQGRSH